MTVLVSVMIVSTPDLILIEIKVVVENDSGWNVKLIRAFDSDIWQWAHSHIRMHVSRCVCVSSSGENSHL